MDSRAQTAPRDSDIIIERLSRVANGFDSLNNPRDSDIIIELLSRVALGCDSANNH